MKEAGLCACVLLLAAACSSNPADPAGGGEDGGETPTEEPATVAGCGDATLYEVPADPAAPGPWPVGAATVTVGRLTVEVWYPATWKSQEGKDRRVYDIREALPASQRDKVPDADNPWHECNCYPDLPLDDTHGPYPVVVFVHGTASFRTQSLRHMTHWASRGFVVAAADHPGLMLSDVLAFVCPDASSGSRDLSGDVDAVLSALAAPEGDLAFLAGHLDMERVALSGHSAGGAVAGMTGKPGVRVVMPFSSGSSVQSSATLASTLFVSGMNDAVASYSGIQSAYRSAPPPKRLVGISRAGHLVVTDLCALQNASGQNMLEVARDKGVCGADFAGNLFDCDPGYLDEAISEDIVNYATSAVLEETLHCRDAASALGEIQSRYPDVGEFQQAL